MLAAAVSLMAASAIMPGAASAAPVENKKSACIAVKNRLAVLRHFPRKMMAYCDIIPVKDSPPGYYVMAIHSRRKCDGICSTNMGWFAIQKATGRVFEWDVAEDRLGPEIAV